MATLKGSRATDGISAKAVHAGTNTVTARYTSTATLSAGDVIQMVKIPAGARVTGITASSQQGGSWAVGDGLDTNRYLLTSSVAANLVLTLGSGATRVGNNLNYEYTADDTVDIDTTAVNATAASVFDLHVSYVLDN